MMLLEGVGDPSGGLGGVSFLRMPLKIKQEDLKTKEARVSISKPKAITGTDADLRRLTKV